MQDKDERSNYGALIDVLRRTPSHCLYCNDVPASMEHALAESLGGRLAAPILCQSHNSEIGAKADAALFENLRPVVNLLRVKRHDGRIGAEFFGTDDDGKRLRVTADGQVTSPNSTSYATPKARS